MWTRHVIAISNLGTVYYPIGYMHGDNEGEGHWQKVSAFIKGEHVHLWADFPEEAWKQDDP